MELYFKYQVLLYIFNLSLHEIYYGGWVRKFITIRHWCNIQTLNIITKLSEQQNRSGKYQLVTNCVHTKIIFSFMYRHSSHRIRTPTKAFEGIRSASRVRPH